MGSGGIHHAGPGLNNYRKEIDMTGKEVKRILKERNITVAQCARETGLNQQALYDMLNERRAFFPKYVKAISEYLNIEVSEEELRDKRYSEERKRNIVICLPETMIEMIKDIAKAEYRSVSGVCRELIEEGLKE